MHHRLPRLSQHVFEGKVGVTHVFPLDEDQILWGRSSVVAWDANGLSIRGYQAFTSMHCKTKSGSVLLSFDTLCTGLHQGAATPISTEPSEESNMCLSYLGFCSGEFERIQPLMFQQSCVTVTV